MIDPGTASIVAAIIALIGASVGFILSQLSEYLRITKNSKIRQKEKIIDKRIAAHEDIIRISNEMMGMVDLTSVLEANEDNPFPRGPIVLYSKERFVDWYVNNFIALYKNASTWIGNDVLKNLNYAQDYFLILNKYLETNEVDMYVFANNVRQDFVDISSNLRESSIKFLSRDAVSLNLKDLSRWHKFSKSKTEKMIRASQLHKHYLGKP